MKSQSELLALAESALRRPVARHTGVRITTVEAKALAHGMCDLLEQYTLATGTAELLSNHLAACAEKLRSTEEQQSAWEKYLSINPDIRHRFDEFCIGLCVGEELKQGG